VVAGIARLVRRSASAAPAVAGLPPLPLPPRAAKASPDTCFMSAPHLLQKFWSVV
jgi:hypothetical protein